MDTELCISYHLILRIDLFKHESQIVEKDHFQPFTCQTATQTLPSQFPRVSNQMAVWLKVHQAPLRQEALLGLPEHPSSVVILNQILK